MIDACATALSLAEAKTERFTKRLGSGHVILHNFWIKEGVTTETTELVSLQTPCGLPSTITEPHLMSSEDASKQASQPAGVRKFKSSPETYFVASDSRKCAARLLTAMRGKAGICWIPEREVDASCHMHGLSARTNRNRSFPWVARDQRRWGSMVFHGNPCLCTTDWLYASLYN